MCRGASVGGRVVSFGVVIEGIRARMRGVLVPVIGTSIALLACAHAEAQFEPQSRTPSYIGTYHAWQDALPFPCGPLNGSTGMDPIAVNRHGLVVGSRPQCNQNDPQSFAAVWDAPDGEPMDLPLPWSAGGGGTTVRDVNDHGLIVGAIHIDDAEGDAIRMFLLDWSTQTAMLPPLPSPTTTWVNVAGVNNRGEIVGYYSDAEDAHPFLWRDGAYHDLPELARLGVSIGAPEDLNDRGWIVGMFHEYFDTLHYGTTRRRGFLRRDDGTIVRFEPLPGDKLSQAIRINTRGDVLVRSQVPGPPARYYIWHPDGTRTVLLKPEGHPDFPTVWDLDEFGRAYSSRYVWIDGVPHDNLVLANIDNVDGLEGNINLKRGDRWGDGRAGAASLSSGSGVTFARRLVKVGDGDVSLDGRIESRDLLVLLGAWGTADGRYDLDLSGIVDLGDLLVVLSHWGESDGGG